MNKWDVNKAVKELWGTQVTQTGIEDAIKLAKDCCGVGCERCVWELAFIINSLTKTMRQAVECLRNGEGEDRLIHGSEMLAIEMLGKAIAQAEGK